MSTVELIRDQSICSRRERRYTATSEKRLQCETTAEDGGLSLGHVIDLSATGIRLLCEGQFHVGQKFHTQLHTARPHGIYRGTVRRVEPWVDGRSVLGCSLRDRIPESVLEELATDGVVNRRSDDRYTLQREAAVSWQLQTRELDVQLMDLSYGGLQIESPAPIPQNARLRVRVELDDEELVLDGQSVWQQETADRYMTGIAFTDREAPTIVSRLIQFNKQSTNSDSTLTNRPAKLLRGLAVATGAVAACYLLTTI